MFAGNSPICRINTFGHRRKNIFYDARKKLTFTLHLNYESHNYYCVLCAVCAGKKSKGKKIMLLWLLLFWSIMIDCGLGTHGDDNDGQRCRHRLCCTYCWVPVLQLNNQNFTRNHVI